MINFSSAIHGVSPYLRLLQSLPLAQRSFSESQTKSLVGPLSPPGPSRSVGKWLADYIHHTIVSCKLSYREFKWLWKERKDPNANYTKQMMMRRIRADALRWIPFSLIVVIPFAELMLPFYLVLYQGAVPIQFHTKDGKIKNHYIAATTMDACKKTLRKLMKEECFPRSAENLAGGEAKTLTLFRSWLERGVAQEELEGLTESQIHIFRQHVWREVMRDGKIMRQFIMALGKSPITGIYYTNKLLKLAGIEGPTLGSRVLNPLARPYLAFRLNKSIELLERYDPLLTAKAVKELTSVETIEAAIIRGISLYMKSENEVKEGLKRWVELREKKVPVEIRLFANICPGACSEAKH